MGYSDHHPDLSSYWSTVMVEPMLWGFGIVLGMGVGLIIWALFVSAIYAAVDYFRG